MIRVYVHIFRIFFSIMVYHRIFLINYLFIFGHAGSLLLCRVSLVAVSRGLLSSCSAKLLTAVASVVERGL